MASFKDCTYFPFYAIYLYFNKIEFRNYQITAMDYKNHTRQSLNLLACWWAQPLFFSKLSLKIVRFNGALRHTAEAWWGTNRPRLAEWHHSVTFQSPFSKLNGRYIFSERLVTIQCNSVTIYSPFSNIHLTLICIIFWFIWS